jgi:hypothetical protein
MNETELKTQTTDITVLAKNPIIDQETYNQAADVMKSIKLLKSSVGDVFDPIVEAAHKAHKAATTKRGEFLKPLEDAEKIVKASMGAWIAEQERKARAAQMEDERIDREKQAAEAAELAALGLGEEAKAVADAPMVAPKPAPAVDRGGVTFRENWTFEITDWKAIPMEYFTLDETKVAGIVRTMKGATNIPGIRAYAVKVPVSR